ncbi:unnamed protein product [Blepharisma stoltei]|uniref:Uncharacterized protein n=1 Tax=Blepharisma stoltei TaxID=1481888 RepID=A0AAU9J4R5_9CILI|nr:unnamed protein product [Blepharisma stoltei]
MISEEEEEEGKQLEIASVSPFNFHDLNLERDSLEESKACLKRSLEGVKVENIRKALERLESQNEVFQKKAADEISFWALKNNLELLKHTTMIKYFYNELSYKRLENTAARYFIEFFQLRGPENLSFSEKTSGIQLGRRIHIAISPTESRTFFIKTHKHGALSYSSLKSSVKEIDPKEVFVYHLLHQLNLGPEAHFFWEDKKNFYIATEDLNERGSFNEYSKFYKKFLNPDIPEEYPLICDELIKIDVISRILRLSDTTTNKENFGFLEINGQISLHLIDFDIKEEFNYIGDGLFEGFLAGNGKFQYASNTDPIIRYALANRNQTDRVQAAAHFFDNNFNIFQAVETSMEHLLHIFKDLDVNINDLLIYCDGIKKNIQLFKERLMHLDLASQNEA